VRSGAEDRPRNHAARYHRECIALCLFVVLMQEEASVAGVLPRQLRERLLLTHPADAETAAQALAGGAIVGHGFANFYAITTRPDAETIRSVNLLKGRPPTQVGSITTTPSRIATVWDFDRLPKGLAPHDVLTLVDTLFMIGPFGFRGPAADRVPNQLTQLDGDIRTAQVIAPGYACPSNDFLARALRATGGDYLYITSANRSRHETGAADEPAHYRADGLRHAFGRDARFVLLEHEDEPAARAAYPAFAPTSTTVLGFHRAAPSRHARATLILERHGSLPIQHVRRAVATLGFHVVSGPGAFTRLTPRQYAGAA
jgi:tRNA A37 threonylcarbamoyladenosine synthetase subunit TsaC/SUA5/YrdC